jgi:hypothetical protein
VVQAVVGSIHGLEYEADGVERGYPVVVLSKGKFSGGTRNYGHRGQSLPWCIEVLCEAQANHIVHE